MKKRFREAIKHPFISGSAIIFLGTFFANILNFIFNIFMGRVLSVSDYGILASLNSLILIFALVAESFVPTVVHFAGTYFAKGEIEKIRGIWFQANKIAVFLGGLSILFFTFFAKNIGNFLNINNNILIFLVGIVVFFGFMGSLNRGILQARLSFKYISFISAFSAVIKLGVGIVLIFLGYKVFSAIYGFLLSFIVLYILIFIPIIKFLKTSGNQSSLTSITKLLSYGAPASIALFSLTFFITSDILLVKHFFPAKEAGIYAGMSLIGKVIYFFTAPIITVMFPIIVHKYSREENYTNTFKLAFFFVFLLSSAITALYFIMPDFTIKLFFKNQEYLTIAPLLGYFGIFITLYSLLAVLTNFYLSVKRTKIFILIVSAIIMQMILIWFNHSSFSQVLMISLISISLPLALLLLYYIWLYEKKN